MSDLLARKAVNALIPDARVSLGARMIGGGLAERTGKAMFGGLWVGGEALFGLGPKGGQRGKGQQQGASEQRAQEFWHGVSTLGGRLLNAEA